MAEKYVHALADAIASHFSLTMDEVDGWAWGSKLK
jgi:hypothetical protein